MILFFAATSAALAALAWRNAERLDAIARQARNRARIEATSLRLQHSILAELAGQHPADAAVIDDLRREIHEIGAEGLHLDLATSGRLDQLHAFLAEPEPLQPERQLVAVDLVRAVLDAEGRAESRRLERIDRRAHVEFELALAVVGTLLVVGTLGGWTLRRRFVSPLADLRRLLTRLGEGEFEAIHVAGVDPLLLPLFRNYNYLVVRLAELEHENAARARTLEAEVRSATQALLAQQRTLARAERLAAVGEMAGSLAHELRNPLAGIRMSLANLRRDVGQPNLAARIDLAAAELDRLARMLNGYLSAARHAPEPLQRVELHALVDDLIALLRYQVPEHVQLECRVARDLAAQLPRDRIRQALLNLVLNSVQALCDAPGSVVVSGRRGRDGVVLSVCDTGPGLPAEVLANGVQAFVTQRDAGTGLGLAMVRRVALDLGGELRFENREPRGACVHLSIPCGLA
jgi:signal transduction histidine kinase